MALTCRLRSRREFLGACFSSSVAFCICCAWDLWRRSGLWGALPLCFFPIAAALPAAARALWSRAALVRRDRDLWRG